MRTSGMLALTLVAAATLAMTTAVPARATAEPHGCCCLATTGGEACTETTEEECLAKQQAVPKYDEKTDYDAALKKSQAEESGKQASGWKAGKCPMK